MALRPSKPANCYYDAQPYSSHDSQPSLLIIEDLLASLVAHANGAVWLVT